jgi:predicted transcriptional regulator of viral defense system
MRKPVFTMAEVRLLALDTKASTLKLELHNWVKRKELIRLKKGVYIFAGTKTSKAEIARTLYFPCYVSLETALSTYGLIPDVPFAFTLVTTRTTRTFRTPAGEFVFRKIKRAAFTGFDTQSLMAEKEKAFVDFLYLNQERLIPEPGFWKEMRLQNFEGFNFRKAKQFAKLFNSNKLRMLLESVEDYARTD